MKPHGSLASVVLTLGLSVAAERGEAGEAAPACPPAPIVGRDQRANIFTPQQEADLGDALHESERAQLRALDEPELSAYLERVGERLLRNVPLGELRFRFRLSDAPVVNAFTLPGGRVYVTRKLVSFTRSEDELAGVLAHELGHSLMHDGAVAMTRRLRQVLNVASVGERQDVFDKYHQILDNARRKPGAFEADDRREQAEQITADQLAVYALTRAGYDPQALAGLWDRFNETGGRTGSWLSDLVGATTPEARRLREMLKTRVALPAACIDARRPEALQEFAAWQAAVVAYDGLKRAEALPGLLWKRALEPSLQAEVQHLRFSPDGRFLLAQDDASIFVLSSEPLLARFRVDAPEAALAQFSPDSKRLVFHTPQLRVESWDLGSGARVGVRELALRRPCLATELSPDARFLACYHADTRLSLLDVETEAPVLEKQAFFAPARPSLLPQLQRLLQAAFVSASGSLVHLAFSPDGRYFLAGAEHTAPVAFDLATRRTLSLPGVFKDLTQRSFTFLGNERVAGLDARDPERSALVRFPGGERLSTLALAPLSRLAAAAGGERLLVRPLGKYPVAALDASTQKLLVANTQSRALDLHGELYVNELGDGTLDLRRLDERSSERVALTALPRSLLGTLRAEALTPDLSWLAVSQRSRGAVWSLQNGARVLQVRGFRGAHVDAAGTLLADFPALGDAPRSMARLGLPRGELQEGRKLEGDANVRQFGSELMVLRFGKPGTPEDVGLEVRDARSDALLWSRPLPGGPPSGLVWPDASGASPTITLAWALQDAAAREQIERDPALKRRRAEMKEPDGDFLLEVLDGRTGRTLGRALLETGMGSFRIERVVAGGGWLVVRDSRGRALILALAAGEPRGRLFGAPLALGEARGLLCLESEPARATVYALASLQPRAELAFASPIALARFSPDGQRLFVLTADQNAYAFDATSW